MKTFVIDLYYYTDLRDSRQVQALDEVRALAMVLSTENWVMDRGFRIEIYI